MSTLSNLLYEFIEIQGISYPINLRRLSVNIKFLTCSELP